MDDLQPEVQGQVAGLKNGPDPHGERLAAGIALAQARTAGLAGQAAYALILAAMGADRALGPKAGFNVFERLGFGLELGGIQDGIGHVGRPLALVLQPIVLGMSSVTSPQERALNESRPNR
jgi:hypothetical protein